MKYIASTKFTVVHFSLLCLFVTASHQTRLDTRSKARRPIKVGIKGRGRLGTSRNSNPAVLCCSSAHLVQCEPDEASSFTNPNVGPGTYAGLWLELAARSSAIHRFQESLRGPLHFSLLWNMQLNCLRHINTSKIIFCPGVRESPSLYIYIEIFLLLILKNI